MPPIDYTLDQELILLGEHIAGFGGLYVDSLGAAVLLTAANAGAEQGDFASIRAALRDSPGALGYVADLPIRTLSAKYTFSQLASWRHIADSVAPTGLIFSDIDERENVIALGISQDVSISGVRERIIDAGIPNDAVQVVPAALSPPAIGNSFSTVDSLIGYVRPNVGGIYILTSPGGNGRNCTLTAGVTSLDEPDGYYFVTNSHCSERVFDLDDTESDNAWYQPAAGFSVIAMVEVIDPSLFSGGDCPYNRVCRYSDATLVRYSDTAAYFAAHVARPYTSSSPFPFIFEDVVHLKVTGFSGTEEYKVGKTTGETHGAPGRSCLNINLPSNFYPFNTIPSNTTLLCQNESNAVVNAGDSGSPVFSLDSLNVHEVKFRGAAFAGGSGAITWYSPLAGIRLDLGNIRFDLY